MKSCTHRQPFAILICMEIWATSCFGSLRCQQKDVFYRNFYAASWSTTKNVQCTVIILVMSSLSAYFQTSLKVSKCSVQQDDNHNWKGCKWRTEWRLQQASFESQLHRKKNCHFECLLFSLREGTIRSVWFFFCFVFSSTWCYHRKHFLLLIQPTQWTHNQPRYWIREISFAIKTHLMIVDDLIVLTLLRLKYERRKPTCLNMFGGTLKNLQSA